MVRAVIFDLDGTLGDTFGLIIAAWNAAVRPVLGFEHSAEEVIARFGIPDTAMLRRELPEAAWEEAIARFHEHYEAEHGMAQVFAGVPEMLGELRQRGLKLGLMTGKGRRSTMTTLRQFGWSEMFEAVVTGEDTTNQKPAPDGLLLAAKQLGLRPDECVYVGDSPGDIAAGKAAGMRTLAAAWHTVYVEQLPQCGADAIVRTPSAVVAALQNL